MSHAPISDLTYSTRLSIPCVSCVNDFIANAKEPVQATMTAPHFVCCIGIIDFTVTGKNFVVT